MDPRFGHVFHASMPAITSGPVPPGQAVFDEGVFVCVVCELPGNEVSLLPGDETPECPSCGEDARWLKT
jgi:hypothetical protein